MIDDRKAVCKRCHHVMDDGEPFSKNGEFYHKPNFADGKPNHCQNAGKTFHVNDNEIEPFMRKGVRRALKRLQKR